jgi:hypothetical protein
MPNVTLNFTLSRSQNTITEPYKEMRLFFDKLSDYQLLEKILHHWVSSFYYNIFLKGTYSSSRTFGLP